MFKKNERDTELLQQQNEKAADGEDLGYLVLRRYGDLRQIWRSNVVKFVQMRRRFVLWVRVLWTKPVRFR